MFEHLELHHGRLRFSAQACGQGPVVLCLHGFPDNARTWRHQLPALADAGFRAIAVALRGYEPGSQPEGGAYAMTDVAGDVLAFIDELGAERVHLVGHDWGAAAAYTVAATAPGRFASLSTIGVPHPGRFLSAIARRPAQLRMSWYMFFFQLRGIAERAVARNDHAFIRRLWRDWSPGWTPPEGTLEDVIDTLRAPGVLAAALSYYRAALSPRALPLTPAAMQAACFQVPVPTLALTGAEEGCVGAEFFREAMRVEDFPAGLEVVTIPGAGHFLHQEQPLVVNALLVDWLRQHDSRRPRGPVPGAAVLSKGANR